MTESISQFVCMTDINIWLSFSSLCRVQFTVDKPSVLREILYVILTRILAAGMR
jgi:hypothetical protein